MVEPAISDCFTEARDEFLESVLWGIGKEYIPSEEWRAVLDDPEAFRTYLQSKAEHLLSFWKGPIHDLGLELTEIIENWDACENQPSTDDPNWQDNIETGEPMSPIDLAFAILKDTGEIYREGEIPRSQVVEDPQTPAQNLWSSMAQDWREHLADTEQCCRRAKKEYMDAIAGTHIDQWDDIAVGEQWSNESRGRSGRPLPSDIESMDCAEFESMIQNQLSSLDGSENAGPYHFSRPEGQAMPHFPDATHPDEGQASLHEALRQVLYIWNDCEERHNELIQENMSDESGDFQASEPMHIDLAFAVLKAALPEGVSLRFDPRWYDNEQMGEDVNKCPNCGTEDINDFFTPENQEQWEMDEYDYPEGHPLCYWCWKDWMKHSANQEQIGRWGR